jgi:hypothetical protein
MNGPHAGAVMALEFGLMLAEALVPMPRVGMSSSTIRVGVFQRRGAGHVERVTGHSHGGPRTRRVACGIMMQFEARTISLGGTGGHHGRRPSRSPEHPADELPEETEDRCEP